MHEIAHQHHDASAIAGGDGVRVITATTITLTTGNGRLRVSVDD